MKITEFLDNWLEMFDDDSSLVYLLDSLKNVSDDDLWEEQVNAYRRFRRLPASKRRTLVAAAITRRDADLAAQKQTRALMNAERQHQKLDEAVALIQQLVDTRLLPDGARRRLEKALEL